MAVAVAALTGPARWLQFTVPQALCMQEFKSGDDTKHDMPTRSHAFGEIAAHQCIKDVLDLDAFLIKQRHRVISGVMNDLDH